MNKKVFIVTFLVLLIGTVFLVSANTNRKIKSRNDVITTKTYELKFISPSEASEILSPYVYRTTYSSGSQFLTVSLPKQNLQKFEEVLRKIDKDKKIILFKIYTIVASKERLKSNITASELKPVVKEISTLFSFKSYKLDGVSSITVKEGTYTKIKLSSSYDLILYIIKPHVRVVKNETRVEFSFDLRKLKIGTMVAKNPEQTIISSSTYIKNNRFFIAGVSSLANTKNSIILIIKVTVLK